MGGSEVMICFSYPPFLFTPSLIIKLGGGTRYLKRRILFFCLHGK